MQEDLNSTDNALPFDMGNIGDTLVTVADSHSMLRESRGPQVGENMCIGGSGEERKVGICI